MKLDFFSSSSSSEFPTRREKKHKTKAPIPIICDNTPKINHTASGDKWLHMLRKVHKEKIGINTLKERMKIFQYYAGKVDESMEKRGEIVDSLIQEDYTDD